jgi:hypothetical protein
VSLLKLHFLNTSAEEYVSPLLQTWLVDSEFGESDRFRFKHSGERDINQQQTYVNPICKTSLPKDNEVIA